MYTYYNIWAAYIHRWKNTNFSHPSWKHFASSRQCQNTAPHLEQWQRNLRPFGSWRYQHQFLDFKFEWPWSTICLPNPETSRLCHSWFQGSRPRFFHPTTSRQIMADGNQRFDSPLTMPPQKRGRHGHMDCFLRLFERIYEFVWNSDLKPSQVKTNTIRIDLRLNQRDTPTGQALVLPDSDTLTCIHSAWRPQGCMTESYTSYICCHEVPRFCVVLENGTIGTPKITGTIKLSCLHVIHFQFGRNSLSSRIHKHF